MIGLYIHIPFCTSKCSYCDFTSYVGKEQLMHAYIKRVIEESAEYAGLLADTLYIGGGTPSCLHNGAIRELISGISQNITLGGEMSIEANPGTLTRQKAEEYAACGINRISLGLQSASPKLLEYLGRKHTYQDFLDAVNIARAAGILNINGDIIYALQTQTLEDIKQTIELTAPHVQHLSAYALKIEKGTPFYRAGICKADEDTDADMYDYIVQALLEKGFARYEISNFALPGYECAHNLKYWNVQPYIGLGLSAHSHYNNERFSNQGGLLSYSRVVQTDKDELTEYIMLKLRTAYGFDIGEFKEKFKECGYVLENARALGEFIEMGERMKLKDKGFALQNALILKLLEQ